MLWIGIGLYRETLGANPIATVLNQLGLLALVFLIASLVCTPLKILFKWTWPMRLRRMLGLFAFFYATLHVTTYVAVDQVFDFRTILEDVVKRQFIFVGFLAWLLLIPLALTSTQKSIRRLGHPRWAQLHQLVYFSAGLALVHFLWRVKADISEPAAYGTLFAILMLIRLAEVVRKKRKQAR